MRLTVETLTLFLLLMPGFVSSAVLNTIAVRQAKGRVDQMIEALVFTCMTRRGSTMKGNTSSSRHTASY